MGSEIAIKRPPGHTKALADTLHGGCPGFIQLERHGKGIRGDRLGASPTAATQACADQAGHGAFPDEIAFELGLNPTRMSLGAIRDYGALRLEK
jgi:hypothetical protein